MGKWSKSLPEPENYEPWKSHRLAGALSYIAEAMVEVERNPRLALDGVRHAAAEVRAWRKSLGVESGRASSTSIGSARASLRIAAWSVLTADGSKGNAALATTYLRYAEAHLREAARLLDREQA